MYIYNMCVYIYTCIYIYVCVYVYNYICILYIDIIRFKAVGQLLPVAFPPSCSNAERAEGPRDTSPKHLSARPHEFHHLTDIQQRPGALGALNKGLNI